MMPKIELVTEMTTSGKAAIVMRMVDGDKCTVEQMMTLLASIVNATLKQVDEMDKHTGAGGMLRLDFDRHIAGGNYDTFQGRVVTRTSSEKETA